MALVKLNNRGVRSATAFGSITGVGSMVLIKKLTSDGSDDDLSFVHGTSDVVLDSTYKEYLFIFKDIHPETNRAKFTFNGSIDAGSNYNVAKTTTDIYSYHNEDDTGTGVGYSAGSDLAQGTGFQALSTNLNVGNDDCFAGYLHLFNPSSDTFVKHFISRGNSSYVSSGGTAASEEDYIAGYFNTTSDIDAVQFKMDSDEIQAGTITLYGIK
jgi:hypothetical protein